MARILLSTALLLRFCDAAFVLPSHFSSSMVVQQGVAVALWGLETPGASIAVSLGGRSLPPEACDAGGRFQVSLPASPASLAQTNISLHTSTPGVADVLLLDVVFGDVYLCSGQSNVGCLPSLHPRHFLRS